MNKSFVQSFGLCISDVLAAVSTG